MGEEQAGKRGFQDGEIQIMSFGVATILEHTESSKRSCLYCRSTSMPYDLQCRNCGAPTTKKPDAVDDHKPESIARVGKVAHGTNSTGGD